MAEDANKPIVEAQADENIKNANTGKNVRRKEKSTKTEPESASPQASKEADHNSEEKEIRETRSEESKPEEKKETIHKTSPKIHTAEDLELDTENVMLFGKYPIKDVVITDPSMLGYVKFNMQAYPNIFGRRRRKSYYDSHISIIERLINKLMRGGTGKKVGGKVIRTNGRLQGKKLKVLHIVEDSFSIINKKTGKNPVQVFVDALQNSAPIEDTTRVRYGGISYNVAVGISANRRVDVALKNIALAALIGAFKKKKSLSEALADELSTASQNLPESYAIKKRVESERIARRAR
jgi:small subunit ribosomal protein S7